MRSFFVLLGFLLLIFLQGHGQEVRTFHSNAYPDSTYRQEPPPPVRVLPKNNIKTNFLPILLGPILYTAEYRLVYERVLFKRISVEAGGSYLGANLVVSMDDYISTAKNRNASIQETYTDGGRGSLAVKVYVDEAPEGIYISPRFSVSYAKFSNRADFQDYVIASYSNLVLLGGYQLIAGKHFVFDVFGGAGIKVNNWEYQSRTNTVFPTDPTYDLSNNNSDLKQKLVFGFNLGFAF